MSHTPEPWEAIPIEDDLAKFGIVCKNQPLLRKPVSDIATIWNRGGNKMAEANAARIVACVNACAGIDIETLVKICNCEMNGSEIWELAQVKKQLDRLLTAVDEFERDESKAVNLFEIADRIRSKA